ncbi:hypothetical protein OOZ15_02980 [Galbibacter sp. EGI 63066]|uniref:DUF6730 family protein n=1 Tax=Galbibacter sp. EGI 63066 TaxID=2993559 RepID=UPI002249127A|nr:DUF6730 family protein [Galbibacter sp. EGI 63066]MCX2678893.1 hypothetical protein [Galbibacter sp. EGI 63066]
MAKLEEIAALLTEEIASFNASVHKLELLSNKLHKVKVKADASEIQRLLEAYLKKQGQFEQDQAKNTQELLGHIDRSKLFPKWLVVCSVIFVALLLTLGFTALHFRHRNQQLKNENMLIKKHYRNFIKGQPEIEAQYLKWTDKDKDPAQ